MSALLADLLCRLRMGEAGAADALAEAARPELARLVRVRLRDHALVDDVVQEALLEVLATHASLRDPAAVTTWLRLIVRKQADRATRRSRMSMPLDYASGIADRSDGPDRLVERRGDVATIRRALRVVRDADALLLRLRYLGEWTDAELAELVGAQPGTVRKRIHDARRRLRAALQTLPPNPIQPKQEPAMPEVEQFLGRIVSAQDVPTQPPVVRTPSATRLETALKVLDAVLPLELGGTADLLGPAGLGQLVLVAEIAVHLDAIVVAAGKDSAFTGLVDDDHLGAQAVVIDGEPAEAAVAADGVAGAFAGDGRTVLLVLDAATWSAAPPTAGVVPNGGSVTAFRFSPHPRDAEPASRLEDAGTTLVYATEPFVTGHHPAIDITASRSSLIERELLDPITLGAARKARQALERAAGVRAFLAQPMVVGEAFTGIPGEQVPAREATEALAALVR